MGRNAILITQNKNIEFEFTEFKLHVKYIKSLFEVSLITLKLYKRKLKNISFGFMKLKPRRTMSKKHLVKKL